MGKAKRGTDALIQDYGRLRHYVHRRVIREVETAGENETRLNRITADEIEEAKLK